MPEVRPRIYLIACRTSGIAFHTTTIMTNGRGTQRGHGDLNGLARDRDVGCEAAEHLAAEHDAGARGAELFQCVTGSACEFGDVRVLQSCAWDAWNTLEHGFDGSDGSDGLAQGDYQSVDRKVKTLGIERTWKAWC